MPAPQNRHPNATAALAGGSGAGALVLWILDLTGLNVPQPAAAAIAGGAAALILLVGRDGIVGLWRAVKYGKVGPPAH